MGIDSSMTKVNIGCGQTPIEGWKNYDNSISIRLAKLPALIWILKRMGVLEKSQLEFISFAIKSIIVYANATRRIPEPDHSVEVLYSSHMLEHLYYEEAMLFLREIRRVLIHSGIIRIVVPDIRRIVNNYIKNCDADFLIEATSLIRKKSKTFIDKVKYLIIGDRGHKWMYDGKSLCHLLSSAGFNNPQIMKEGTTNIQDPGELDLFERSTKSVYIEAVSP